MHGSAHDQVRRPAGVSATPQRLVPPVLRETDPAGGCGQHGTHSIQGACCQAGPEKTCGFLGLLGRTSRRAAAREGWGGGQLVAFLGVSPGREPELVQAGRDLGVRQSAPREASWRLAQAPRWALSSGSSMEDLGCGV